MDALHSRPCSQAYVSTLKAAPLSWRRSFDEHPCRRRPTAAGTPQHDDQPSSPRAVPTVAGAPHHGDDLLGARQVGRIAATLVARRATGPVSRSAPDALSPLDEGISRG